MTQEILDFLDKNVGFWQPKALAGILACARFNRHYFIKANCIIALLKPKEW